MIGSLIQSIVGLRRSQAVALPVLYCGRFMGGLGVGMVSALVPSYVSESVPRMIRGRCTGMIQLANNVGIMLSCGSRFLLLTMVEADEMDNFKFGSIIPQRRTFPLVKCNGVFPSLCSGSIS